MPNFGMTCTCGDTMSIEAGSKHEAVSKMQSFMTQQALDEHMTRLHKPGDPKPSLQEAHQMIQQHLAAV